ncbi:MAG: site-specific DNA-methyltransferase [Acidimicrobiales bacterium]
MSESNRQTSTSAFGVGRREGHDSSAFYQRFSPPVLSSDQTVNRPEELLAELGPGRSFVGSIERLGVLPENSVALVVTSPPYFVGKEYELAVTGESGAGDRLPATYFDYLEMLRTVFAECSRVLEPGGRIAVNVANLGRKPYRSLSADVISILQDDLGLLLRGEVIWEKAAVSSGSCAWGSFAKASNPVLRDMTERVVIASKGRFSRALTLKQRRERGLPHESSLANDEFVDVTRDVWRIDAESATRIGHPAPFPVELPRRLIDLYTYRGDIVVDPFVGSGTSMVAAARTGRIGVGFDIDPDYVELAEQRFAAELDRIAAFDAATEALVDAPLPLQGEVLGGLSVEDRQEHFQARAVTEGKKVQHIARRLLEDAGFTSIDDRARHRSGVVEFTFRIGTSGVDGSGNAGGDGDRSWGAWVDVSGGFTSSRPGLQRIDAVWRLLGRLHVLSAMAAAGDENPATVLVLTSNLPKRGSPADKALRAGGPGLVFDAIELYDPAGLARLRCYAAAARPSPQPGFWTPQEVDLAAG